MEKPEPVKQRTIKFGTINIAFDWYISTEIGSPTRGVPPVIHCEIKLSEGVIISLEARRQISQCQEHQMNIKLNSAKKSVNMISV